MWCFYFVVSILSYSHVFTSPLQYSRSLHIQQDMWILVLFLYVFSFWNPTSQVLPGLPYITIFDFRGAIRDTVGRQLSLPLLEIRAVLLSNMVSGGGYAVPPPVRVVPAFVVCVFTIIYCVSPSPQSDLPPLRR